MDGSGSAQQPTTEKFVYDGRHVRLELKHVPQGTGAGAPPAADQLSHRFTYADAIDMVLLDEQFVGGLVTRRWQLADHQGSIRDTIAVGESSATMPSHQWVDYDSFGNRIGTADNGSRFGYTGREYDAASGLQWNRARWYDPKTGTFVGQDPLGPAGGDENLYRYVGNNPLTNTDPTGTTSQKVGQSGNAPSMSRANYLANLPTSGGGGGYGGSTISGMLYPTSTFTPQVGASPFTRSALDGHSGLLLGVPEPYVPPPVPNYLVPPTLSVTEHVSMFTEWERQVASGAHKPGLWEKAGMSLLTTLLPPSGSAYTIKYADGTTVYRISDGPTSGGYFGQVLAVGSAGTAAAKGAVPFAANALEEIADALYSQITGLPFLNWKKGKAPDATSAVPSGQFHHPISKPVAKALEEHPTLSGQYKPRDPRFTTQAIDEAAHKGYQTWHRELDAEVSHWIRTNPQATPASFESYLRERYNQPDLKARFPDGF